MSFIFNRNRDRNSYASVAAGTATPAYPYSLRDGQDSNDSTPQHSRSQTSLIDAESMDMDKAEASFVRGRYDLPSYESKTFTPSYLRRSRHIERLESAYAHRDKSRDPRSHNGLGSRQQSSTNLSVARPSGSTPRSTHYDVVERSPTQQGDRARPLPSRWNEHDKCNGLEITGSGLEIKYQGVARTPDDAAAVRADFPVPEECGLYYYEVTVLSKGNEGLIGVGFSGAKSSLSRLPGWEDQSWGYHGDDGCSFACSAVGKQYGPKFSTLDTIGCGLNFRTNTMFFTKNGILLGDAFSNIPTKQLYPSVGIKKPGEQLRANFGQTPFIYDIDDHMEARHPRLVMTRIADFTQRERRVVAAEIDSMRLPLQPAQAGRDESDVVNELIAQYLAHEGFMETGLQFAHDVRQQKASLQTNGPDLSIETEATGASQRQQIRSAILAGDIDKAFKYLSTYFPQVLEEEANRDIYFRLRCRKFIEMILRSYEVQSGLMASAESASSATNGHGKGRADTNGFGMDIDSQNGRTDTMAMSIDDLRGTPAFSETKSAAMLHNELLNEAIQYGMGLQAEFNQDPRKEVQKALSDTFALIAYTDARESGLAEMMEGKGRVDIAEQVNGAILVSLGKPRCAMLEQLCAQTEVLLQMLASKTGGGASFINLAQDYLQ